MIKDLEMPESSWKKLLIKLGRTNSESLVIQRAIKLFPKGNQQIDKIKRLFEEDK